MLNVDRANYAPSKHYGDRPVSIGYSVTISAPHMHAWALEKLAEKLVPGSNALDVGCGSGIMVAAMGHLVQGSGGKCVGIDYRGELVNMSQKNLAAACPNLLKDGTIEVIQGNGWKGYEKDAPYDAIHVAAAATTTPDALLDQLKPGGRMVIPVGPDGNQMFVQWDKNLDGSTTQRKLFGVRYGPLVKIG